MSKPYRCGGAEQHGNRWRVRLFFHDPPPNDKWDVKFCPEGVAVDGLDGESRVLYSGPDPEKAARAYVVQQRASFGQNTRSVGETMDEYLAHLKEFGGPARKPKPPEQLETIKSSLEPILGIMDPAIDRRAGGFAGTKAAREGYSRPLTDLTPRLAATFYEQRRKVVANATHHGDLLKARAFFKWCVGNKYVRVNPYQDIALIGQAAKGKDQFGLDEARKFYALACTFPECLPRNRTMALIVSLIFGTRPGELLKRIVGDLDDDGGVLRIRRREVKTEGVVEIQARVKNDKSVRRLRLPPLLRWQVGELVKGKAPGDLIFGDITPKGKWAPVPDSDNLRHAMTKLCALAGIPTITPYGLRGTQETLTIEVDGHIAAAAYQHGHSSGMAKAHYLAGGTEMSSRAAIMEALLNAKLDPRAELAEAEARVARLKARIAEEAGDSGQNPVPNGIEEAPKQRKLQLVK